MVALKWWKMSGSVTLKAVSILMWFPPHSAGDLPQTMVIVCYSQPFEEEIWSLASGRPHVHQSLLTLQKECLWDAAQEPAFINLNNTK